MELATRITAVETRGDWFNFKTEQGFSVATKHADVVGQVQQLLGQPVVIDYAEKASDKINPHTSLPFVNRYLNGIRPANGSAPTPDAYALAGGLTPEAVAIAQGWSPPQELTPAVSDDRGQRMGRNNIAAGAADAILKFTDGKPETIQRILDGLAAWSESGTPLFTAASVAAPAPTDDIPF